MVSLADGLTDSYVLVINKSEDIGSFQVLDLIITKLKSQMTR